MFLNGFRLGKASLISHPKPNLLPILHIDISTYLNQINVIYTVGRCIRDGEKSKGLLQSCSFIKL